MRGVMKKLILILFLLFPSVSFAATVTVEIKDVIIVQAATERGLDNPTVDKAQEYYADILNNIINTDAETNLRKNIVKVKEQEIEDEVEDAKSEWEK